MSDTRPITNRETLRMLDGQIAGALGWRNVQVEGHTALGEPPGRYGHIHIPFYSTDANAALSLVKGYFKLEAVRGNPTNDDAVWRARFGFDNQEWHVADTPAEAICTAFMAYKGEGE